MSEKPVIERLYVKPGNKFLLINPPPGYTASLGKLPDGVSALSSTTSPVDVIQWFVTGRKELESRLTEMKKLMAPKTILWVTYTKGTSKIKTDINRDTINAYAQTIGLVGVAMISIDDDWSALRLKLV